MLVYITLLIANVAASGPAGRFTQSWVCHSGIGIQRVPRICTGYITHAAEFLSAVFLPFILVVFDLLWQAEVLVKKSHACYRSFYIVIVHASYPYLLAIPHIHLEDIWLQRHICTDLNKELPQFAG